MTRAISNGLSDPVKEVYIVPDELHAISATMRSILCEKMKSRCSFFT